jgi:hypothetical protein
MPSPGVGQYFIATLASGSSKEIIKVTSLSGNNMICLRAQEGTTASAFGAGTVVELRITAESLKKIADDLVNLSAADKYLVGAGAYNAATNTLALNMSDGSSVGVDMTPIVQDTIDTIPASSTSTLGKVKLSTTDLAIAGSDTTTAVTPLALNAAIYAAKDAFD